MSTEVEYEMVTCDQLGVGMVHPRDENCQNPIAAAEKPEGETK